VPEYLHAQATSVEEIRAIADATIGPIIAEFQSVALVGFPDHSNVGDSAIWLGELAYLKARSVTVAYSCSSESYRKENLERHTDGDTPILIHGGGYFGDIWPTGLDFMLRMVDDFPDRSIIVMPQTIHFQSASQRERARRVINGHRSMTICVRDHRSAHLAREYFEHPVVLAPDSAVFLDLHTAVYATGVLYLAREDREAHANRAAVVEEGIRQTDWVDLPAPILVARMYPSFLHRSKARMQAHIGSSDSAAWQEAVAAAARNALARHRLQRGVRLLASAEIVVTDRLHAHILSVLLDLPHVLLDNNYGKVRAYYDTWSQDSSLVQWALSPDEAFVLARDVPMRPH